MRVIDFFDRGLMLAPERACLSDDATEISYREAAALTHQVARLLRSLGVEPGDAVAFISPNDAFGYVAALGILRAEAGWVPLNVRNTVADNIHHLEVGRPKALLYHSSFEADVAAYRAAVPSITHAICIDAAGAEGPGLRARLEAFDATPVAYPAGRVDSADLFRISCTGGTTGTPKGVRHNHLSYEMNVAAYLALWSFEAPPRFLLVAPMTHAGGALAPPVFALGGTVRMMAKNDPLRIMQVIAAERISAAMLPPTAIYMLLDHPQVRDFDYSSLRYFMFAAAPMAPEKIRRAIDIFGPCFAQFYAQTEVATTITWMSPGEYAQAVAEPELAHRLRSAGRPGPFSVLGIMNADGQLLGDGEVGEIVVRSNQVMAGYVDQEEATREVFAYGWHHTGDLGYRDGDGYYYLVDRKRDLVITGGFNVFPGEVEKVLLAHPAIQDCAVIGIPDEKWGEALTAVVQLAPGQVLDAETLRAWSRERLSGVMTPKHYEFWEELPKSPVGKVLKRKIRDRFWQDQARAI